MFTEQEEQKRIRRLLQQKSIRGGEEEEAKERCCKKGGKLVAALSGYDPLSSAPIRMIEPMKPALVIITHRAIPFPSLLLCIISLKNRPRVFCSLSLVFNRLPLHSCSSLHNATCFNPHLLLHLFCISLSPLLIILHPFPSFSLHFIDKFEIDYHWYTFFHHHP